MGTPGAVTGFDETVPPDDDPARDENAAAADPKQRETDAAINEAPPAGQHGPTADYGEGR